MQYESNIADAFSEWLVGGRAAATGFKVDQAIKTRFKELLIPASEMSIEIILKRAGIEEEKAEEILDGLLGEYISVLIDVHTTKSLQRRFPTRRAFTLGLKQKYFT
jgi:hypothetical protein